LKRLTGIGNHSAATVANECVIKLSCLSNDDAKECKSGIQKFGTMKECIPERN